MAQRRIVECGGVANALKRSGPSGNGIFHLSVIEEVKRQVSSRITIATDSMTAIAS